MEDMKGAKIHIFESESETKVAKTFRYHFAHVSVLKQKAKEYIDKQLSEFGIVTKLKK
jgi:hypothetical protein